MQAVDMCCDGSHASPWPLVLSHVSDLHMASRISVETKMQRGRKNASLFGYQLGQQFQTIGKWPDLVVNKLPRYVP